MTGIDPSLEQAGAMLGARRRERFWHIILPLLIPGLAITFCLSFVQAFAVFPSAVMLGEPAGSTRVISIAAYTAAFEEYDYSLASAIAMIMGLVQVVIVVAGARIARLALSRSGGRRQRMNRNRSDLGEKLWATAVWAVVIFFVVNLIAMVATVLLEAFARRWLGSWLPAGYTLSWFSDAWDEFQLYDVLVATFEVVGAVVLISGLVGVPAAYALARRNFPGKQIVVLLFLLPLLVPTMTYGIPLATVLYRAGFAGTISGVILANLVPTVPFVIFVMVPFIEQIDPRMESAARVFGAGTGSLFRHVLVPLLTPGILAALLLVLVRTIAMFELSFLTAGPGSQTLVVALYYSVFAAGVRAQQSINAMAVIYMVTTMIWLLIALRFVNPTQIVTRARREAAP